MKQCTKCKQIKELKDFTKNKRHNDGLNYRCKNCNNIYERKYRQNSHSKELTKIRNKQFRKENPNYFREYEKKHPNKSKNRWLKRNFNITLEIYNKFLEEQNYCCKICLKNNNEFKQALSVDHCHKTGKIRGLLCYNCNRGIGLLQDDFKICMKAAEYLKNT